MKGLSASNKHITPLPHRKGLGMGLFLSFVIKEAKHILRDKRTMLILFGMPVVMMLIFGFAITTDVKNVRTVKTAPMLERMRLGL